MHELSLAQGLIGQLTDLAKSHNASRIITARVNIGNLAGIVVDSFTFGFDAIKAEQKCTCNATLEISEVEGTDLVLAQVVME